MNSKVVIHKPYERICTVNSILYSQHDLELVDEDGDHSRVDFSRFLRATTSGEWTTDFFTKENEPEDQQFWILYCFKRLK